MKREISERCRDSMAIHFACLIFDPFGFHGTSHYLTVVFGVGCTFVVAHRISR